MTAAEQTLLESAMRCLKRARLAAGRLRGGETILQHLLEGFAFLEAIKLPTRPVPNHD